MNRNQISNQFHKLSFQIGDAEDVQFSFGNLLQLRSAQNLHSHAKITFAIMNIIWIQNVIDEAIKAIL
jgi:hypothetical protein